MQMEVIDEGPFALDDKVFLVSISTQQEGERPVAIDCSLTVTPGSTPPLVSVIVPCSVALLVWAAAGSVNRAIPYRAATTGP